MKNIKQISDRNKLLSPFLDEKTKRLFAAAESQVLGHGGIAIVSKATGISRTTISSGLKELKSNNVIDPHRIRQKGGGRKKAVLKMPEIKSELAKLIEPALRGEPYSPLMWTSKSLRNLSDELKAIGINASHNLVGEILNEEGFSLQANRKTDEGKSHPDRNAQFEFIHNKILEFQSGNQPVISVDAKKKELVGNFKNAGKKFRRKKEPEKVKAYDFPSDAQNWRGKPLLSYEVIVNLIASTKTKKGLELVCELNENKYEIGTVVSDQEIKSLNLVRPEFHGEWNYKISPNTNLNN